MDQYERLAVFFITFHHINVLIITLAINVGIYVKARKDKLLYSFLFLQGTMMLWMIAKIFKTVAPVIELRWFFIVLQYFAICLLEVGFFEFSFIYSKGERPKIHLRLPLYILATIQFVIIATNPYHHLFYSEFDFWGDEFGIIFYVHSMIIYSVLLFGIVKCGTKLKKTIKNRRQYYVISLAIILPIIANVLYITGIARTFINSLGFSVTFDVTPIVFTMTLFIFIYAIYRQDFLDMMPIFKDEIIKHIQTAIIVTDQDHIVIECNDEAKFLMGFGDMLERKTLEAYLMNSYARDDVAGMIAEIRKHEAVKLEWKHKNNHFEIHKKPYIDSKEVIKGYIYTIYDITDYIKLKESIKDQNESIIVSNEMLEERIELSKEVSRMAARNYFARELHDILGHSMTVTIKLLEVSSLSYSDDKELAMKQLVEAAGVASKGYTDLRKSVIHNFEAENDYRGLKNDIKKIAKILEVAGIHCEIETNKDYGLISDLETQVIKRFCQEGITNALKHGKATKVKIQLKFEKNGNQISCLNNGEKPSALIKGNGLKGLDYRVKELGGRVIIVNEGPWFGFCMMY